MNPAETGMLMGFRPFIELVAVPFWGNVAERWRRWKTVLLFSLFCWVAFTLSLAFIQPDVHSCLVGNDSYVVLAEVRPDGAEKLLLHRCRLANVDDKSNKTFEKLSKRGKTFRKSDKSVNFNL